MTKPKKVPSKAETERSKFHKGEINRLEKRINNLEDRIAELEKKLEVTYTKKTANKKQDKLEKSDKKRQDLLKKYHPDYRDE